MAISKAFELALGLGSLDTSKVSDTEVRVGETAFDLTSAQTQFDVALGDLNATGIRVEAFLNGRRLEVGNDFTIDAGTAGTVTMAAEIPANNEVNFVVFKK
jgi:hypothetical protein